MAYKSTKRYPAERAAKTGHMQLIEDPHTRQLLASFRNSMPLRDKLSSEIRAEHTEQLKDCGIRRIITVDGGECYPENSIDKRRLAFLKVCALPLRMVDIESQRAARVQDPREVNRFLQNGIWINGGVIPLAGVRIPGRSVRESIRQSIDQILVYTGLNSILQYLVSREWDPGYFMGSGSSPHFNCRSCGRIVYLPKSSLRFQCLSCGHEHMLSDYLQIDQESSDESARAQMAQALRNVLEILVLMHLIWSDLDRPDLLGQTLYMRDGPLMLRAGLYRLVDDIRAFIQHLDQKGLRLHLLGVEKNGDVASHASTLRQYLPDKGYFFLPSRRYVAEEIHGRPFNAKIHRSRALFGEKVFARLGPGHLLALNVPVRDITQDPSVENLLGFQAMFSALSGLLSYQYENALIPIVLANRFASLSQRFSGSILNSFAVSLIRGHQEKDE